MRGSSLLLAAATVALMSGPALAQEFGEWDENEDTLLAEDEFTAGIEESGVYDEWDEDDSGAIEEDEFNTALYEGWDEDDSGVIEEEEFEEDDGWF